MERIYRDAVHNIIRVRLHTDGCRLLARLIDTAEFQCLRRVRQLGLGYVAYHTAEHSSSRIPVGACHLASRILAKLTLSYDIPDEKRIGYASPRFCTTWATVAFPHVIEENTRLSSRRFYRSGRA